MLKKLLQETAIYGFGDFLFRLLAFIVFPLYTYAFTVEEFGVLTLATTMGALVMVFLNLGMNNAVQRFYWAPETLEDQKSNLISTGLWILISWSLLITFIVILCSYPFKHILLAQYKITWLIVLLVLLTNIPNQAIQYCLDTLRLHFSPWKFTFLSGCKNLLGVILGLLFIFYYHLGLKGFFWGNLLGFLLILPVGFWLIRKDLRLVFEKEVAQKTISYGYPFIFAGLAYWLFSSIDRWMLGAIADTKQVGLYGVSFKFASLMIFLNMAFGQAWSPYAIKIFADRPDYRTIYSKVLTGWFFFLSLIGTVIIFFTHEALQILTPESYWPAVNSVGFLTIGFVLYGTTQITALGISLEKKTQILSYAAWSTALVNILLNMLLIPRLGATGAALATSISYFFLTCFYLFHSQKLHSIPLEHKKLAGVFSIIFISLISSYYLNRQNISVGLIVFKSFLIFSFIILGKLLKIFDLQKIKLLLQGKES